jgi:BNR/Asp-box repeat.
MEKKIQTKNSIVCQNENSIFNYFGWPSVVKLPDGTLAAVASGFRLSHICPFGKSIICYSRNEGESWTAPAVLIDTPLDDRDSGITVFDGNKVIVTSFNNSVKFQRDWINAYPNLPRFSLVNDYLDLVNAKEAEDAFLGSTYVISEDGGYSFGPIKRVPVQSIHGPCELVNHKLLYVGRPFYNGVQENHLEVFLQNDFGEFELFSSIESVNPNLLSCEPHAIALPSGKIIVHIRMQTIGVASVRANADEKIVFTTYQCESFDNGKTFTKPHEIGLKTGAPSHLLRHSSGILIASYGYREKPYGQRVMFSKDDGETWDMDYILRDDGPSSDLGYPCTVELADGSLLTVYYQQKTGEQNCVIMQSTWNLPEHIRIGE